MSLLCALLEDVDGRKDFTFEEFKESPAAGGDVIYLVGDAIFRNRCQRIAATGDREPPDRAIAIASVWVPWPN